MAFPRTRNQREITLRDLPKDSRIWRLHWFDELVCDVENRVRTILVPLKDRNVADSFDYSEYGILDFGVALLPRLKIGLCFENGNFVNLQWPKTLLKQVQFGESTRIVTAYSGPSDSELPPYAYRTCRGFQSKLISTTSTGSKYGRVLIPCHEIFRFYYASSSAMVDELLHPEICYEHPQRIFNPELTSVEPGGVTRIMMSKHVNYSDAPVVARFALSDLAWRRACSIKDSLIRNRNNSGGYFVECLPPFAGSTDLEVEGLEFSNAGRLQFLVLRIISCSKPMPYGDIVEFDSEHNNDDPEIDTIREKAEVASYLSRPKFPDTVPITSVLEPNRATVPIPLESIELRFKDLAQKQFNKTVKQNWRQDVQREYLPVISSVSTEFATGEGTYSDGPGRVAVSVDLLQKEPAPPALPASFSNTSGAFELLAARCKLKVERVPVEEQRGVPVFPLIPRDHKHFWWAFIDPNTAQRRQVLALQIRDQHGRFFYFLEAEQAAGDHFRMVLFRFNKFSLCPFPVLKTLLRSCVAHEGRWHKTLPQPGITFRLLKHSSKTIEALAEKLGERITELTD